MHFEQTNLEGVYLIDLKQNHDERGSFTRLYCKQSFLDQNINFIPEQVNLSTNRKAFTLRGMHYQKYPFEEQKLIQVTRGELFDVALDIREGSATFGKWQSFILSADKPQALYLPKGIAHGFLTLQDKTHLTYHMGQSFIPDKGCGIRWNDPYFAIEWPHEPHIMSERDAHYLDFEKSE